MTYSKRLAFALVIALGLLLMVPNIVLLVAGHHAGNARLWVALIAVPAMLIGGWFMLTGRILALSCLLVTPVAMLVPLVSLYAVHYGVPVNESLLTTLVTSNQEEAREFFGGWLWMMILAIAACGGLAVLAAWQTRRSGLRWRLPRVLAVCAGLAALAVVVVTAGSTILVRQQLEARSNPTRLTGISIHIARNVQRGYPFGLAVSLAAWQKTHARSTTTLRHIKAFRFHPQPHATTAGRQIYVLVIGESSRRNHWQLFGYHRPTNPELSHVHNLVPITRMISPWPLTIGAVPVMLTRKPAAMPLSEAFDEASIVQLMHEAGFDTWWLSNQRPVGQMNAPIAVYANRSDHTRWLYLHHYDQSLPQTLAKVIADTHDDLFVVLHMAGSHVAYDQRYPADFKHFRPTMSDTDADGPAYRRTVNSYDNTLLYTDHILAETISVLRESGAASGLWYASDHGETLPSASCSSDSHGHGFRYEFPVPALFWYSTKYATTFPDNVATLKRHADKRVSSADTFASVAAMAGVTYAGQDESRSLFSTHWQAHPRIIHPHWQRADAGIDYDTADLGDGCQRVRAR